MTFTLFEVVLLGNDAYVCNYRPLMKTDFEKIATFKHTVLREPLKLEVVEEW